MYSRKQEKKRMIDIHSHILPNIDDGAKNTEMSLEMAQSYIENGYTEVIATPHWIEYGGTPKRERVIEVLSSFKKRLEVEGIDLKIHLGNEFFITPNLLQYIEEKEGATLNNSDYVLVELPMREYPQYVESVLFDLQLKGYRPIIAHPERYSFYREDPNRLGKLISKGIYAQMNFPSIAGQYGKEVQKSAEIFLKHNLIHLAGTDSHSNRRRSPKVKEAVKLVKGIVGEDEFHAMTTSRPAKIIANEEFVVKEPVEVKRKKWFQFWR